METTLVSLCIRAVTQNMDLLENRLSELPASLLKDLLPHLNIFYLDRIEETALLKGVSTSLAWAAKWRNLSRTWRCKLKFMQHEKTWKQMCLERLFQIVLIRKGQVENLLCNQSEHAVLSMSARHVESLQLTAQVGCRLASAELRPILSVLEERVRCLMLSDALALHKQVNTDILFVLHRLLDHGSVTEVVLKKTPVCSLFKWITARCRGPYWIDPQASETTGSRDEAYNEECWAEEGPSTPKRPRLDPYSDEDIWSRFSSCRMGQIHSLNLEVCSLAAVSQRLPSWLCLQSLHVFGTQPLYEDEVAGFVASLRKLSLNPHSSLRNLNMGNVWSLNILADLLTANQSLESLSLDTILPECAKLRISRLLQFRRETEFSLKKLSLQSNVVQTVQNIPAVLQHAPHLSSLYISGIRHVHLFLHTLSESNPLLKVLILEDVNLTDCHQEIIHLLENSSIEELSLKDCRLLERCTEKKDFLVPFVVAVRGLCTLHSLSLSQNRLAKSAIEIADLFLGDCPSKITKLDLSSNFILPADLLEFSQRVEMYRPAQKFTLDLRFNPLDRDLEVKGQALKKLLPFCNILTNDWDSRSTMADHVSVM